MDKLIKDLFIVHVLKMHLTYSSVYHEKDKITNL
jgi:hypothetical protein